MWLYAEYLAWRPVRVSHSPRPRRELSELEMTLGKGEEEVKEEGEGSLPASSNPGALQNGAAHPANGKAHAVPAPVHGAVSLLSLRRSGAMRCLLAEPDALRSALPTLRAGVEVGTWVAWFFLSDRTELLPTAQRVYVRDTFLFLFLALTTVAAVASKESTGRPPSALNRRQTDEWKGWMQVLFLLYHYYAAKEVYNAIRVFIAAYVWMTGYGNFAYYYKTSDFGLGRFCQMMWRLNFLVVICCLALGNSYMLYYICPMHTLFTVLVYAALGIGYTYNRKTGVIWAKMAACLALVFLLWDVKPVFDAVWAPLKPFLSYTDPRRPLEDPMHEWYFRTSLDRYIWVHGMACAYLMPRWEVALAAMEGLRPRARRAAKASVLAVCGATALLWYTHVYTLPKLQYNAVHPYTSWIPITVFIVVRNLLPSMRSVNLALYGWLGGVTLETYIGQFHTWLLTRRPDGQPVLLLALAPGYPLLNFAVVTGIYVLVSHRLHSATITLRDALVPHDDNAALARNAVLGVGLAAVMGIWGVALSAGRATLG